jgi:hypothetical protein
MDFADTFALRDSDIAAEDFDGEFVVLDLTVGRYFSLAGGAAIAWRALAGGHTLGAAVTAFPEADPRRGAVMQFAEQLVTYQLLKAGAGAPAPDPAVLAQLAASPGPFEIEVFDDLADLLLADPIHDVDAEAGWPHLPGKRQE